MTLLCRFLRTQKCPHMRALRIDYPRPSAGADGLGAGRSIDGLSVLALAAMGVQRGVSGGAGGVLNLGGSANEDISDVEGGRRMGCEVEIAVDNSVT